MASDLSLAAGQRGGRVRPVGTAWLAGDGGLVCAATLAFLAIHAATGFSTLPFTAGDNDSLLRMVEVRDLLGGQSWFDLHQYRMGPDGGFLIHWSRLVDAPLAGLLWLGRAVGGSEAAGEFLARVAWPLLLFAGAIFAVLRLARLVAGPAAAFPALVLGTAALHYGHTFSPGSIDHHNIQLTLTLLMLWWLAEAPRRPALAAAAGVAGALMLGIGMETAPYVAVAGLFVAARFLIQGEEAGSETAGFGVGFAGAAAVVMLVTVAPPAWGESACDAFSAPHALLALVGGLGLAGAAALPALSGSLGRRLATLALLGGACAGLLVLVAPQCLGAPFAGMDPRLKTYWLDAVSEAQPFHRLLFNDAVTVAGSYVTPFLAIVLFARLAWRDRATPERLVFGVLLLAAVIVSLWQVRGSTFSVPLAAVMLAGFVAEKRQAALKPGAPKMASAAMALSWLAAFPIAWALLALFALPASTRPAAAPAGPAGDLATCNDARAYDRLAALPPARVLAVSNLGSPILLYTHHHALAGPYHRNVAGNLAALDIWMGGPAEAEARMRAASIDLVAFCPGNPETGSLAADAPEGFSAALGRGEVPVWLAPVEGSTGRDALRLFRVSAP